MWAGGVTLGIHSLERVPEEQAAYTLHQPSLHGLSHWYCSYFPVNMPDPIQLGSIGQKRAK